MAGTHLPNSSTSYYKTQKRGTSLLNMDAEEDQIGSGETEHFHEMDARTPNSSVSEAEVSEIQPDAGYPDKIPQGSVQTSTPVTNVMAEKNGLPKPTKSYISMIASAILESPGKRLSLGSIYSWIEEKHPYFKTQTGQGWRNSVRHNLSLNDCFIKAGRCEDGKGNYWTIHPHNVEDFKKGEYRQQRRRRRGRRKETEAYFSYLANSQIPLDPATGAPWCFPYTPAERQAYRLDEAIMRQSMKSLERLRQQNKLTKDPGSVGSSSSLEYHNRMYNNTPYYPARPTTVAPAQGYETYNQNLSYSYPTNTPYYSTMDSFHPQQVQHVIPSSAVTNAACHHHCLCCYRQ